MVSVWYELVRDILLICGRLGAIDWAAEPSGGNDWAAEPAATGTGWGDAQPTGWD
jgi:hypothetical protein